MIDKTTRPEKNQSDKESNDVESFILNTMTKLSDETLAAKNNLLKIWGMTVLQHNALDVLYQKDINNTGLSSREIGQGLNTRVPDVTRLLDRLADKGWVIRERDTENRRVVRTRLTEDGKNLVNSAANPMKELQEKLLDHLSKQEKNDFAGLLKKACKN